MTDTDRIDELIRTTGRIESKVDQLDTKLDGHAEKLAGHDVRIAMLERTAQRSWERFALWVGVLAAVAASILPALLR
ncbi:MAG TPA: hypothetical protein VFX16_21105 [Pseudonocardiaceae bacterium]|nr:hypothetical protein [Pseudonocardiaceae bacterium]